MEKIAVLLVMIVSIISTWLFGKWYYERKMSRMLNRLSEMIESAKNGQFRESTYDESKLSAIESKMRQYLLESGTSKEQLSKERDEIKTLISDIAHQTKTPISNIMLYGQLLDEEGLSVNGKTYINQLNHQTTKLSFLVQALVNTSRLETGMIHVTPKRQLLRPLLEDIIKDLQPMFNEKQQSIHLQCGLEQASFDYKWTKEALLNIVDNANKYTKEAGEITIKVLEYESFCRIDIQDSGIGIKESEINKIFIRFYRSKEVYHMEGVGIGLFLTREIIMLQGGYIKVASKQNQGSLFSVFLPKS